jgi:hypothetical protein
MAMDCLDWKRAQWERVDLPRETWGVAAAPPRGWAPAEMPCEWPARQLSVPLGWRRPPHAAPRPAAPGRLTTDLGMVVIV